MARGIAAGEGVVSQAATEQYRSEHDRIFGERPAEPERRGRWVWDPKQEKLVRPWEVLEPDTSELAANAPVMVGRFYEGVPSGQGDGVVFQSRAQHRRYMREKGLTTIDDYNGKDGAWDRAEAKRAQGTATPEHRRHRQDLIGRRLYEVGKMKQEKYDQQVREAAGRRARRGTGEPTRE